MKPIPATTTTTTTWRSLSKGLKRAQIQQIATSIGAPLTGTKPQLITSIDDILNSTRERLLVSAPNSNKASPFSLPHDLRVLSIDMGVRNLAHAFLTCRVDASSRSRSSSTLGSVTFAKPQLCRWQRTSLAGVGVAGMEVASPGVSVGLGLRSGSGPGSDVAPSSEGESFEPHAMARSAYKFAQYCMALRPTHILIERQRFRSGGQAAVQEWSLRVGMLEAMLYATFHTLLRVEEPVQSQTQGQSQSQSQSHSEVQTAAAAAAAAAAAGAVVVEPMLPMRVNKYWFRGDEHDAPATGKHAKMAKIAIVADMLRGVDMENAAFSVHSDVEAVVVGFGKRPTVKSERGGTDAGKKATKAQSKLDDLSDALLQGLGWLHWQENRLKVLNGDLAGLGVVT